MSRRWLPGASVKTMSSDARCHLAAGLELRGRPEPATRARESNRGPAGFSPRAHARIRSRRKGMIEAMPGDRGFQTPLSGAIPILSSVS